MDVIFCGTPKFAVPTLQALHDAGLNVRLVVTQPDRPSGRGLAPTASPVKQLAVSLGLPLAQPDKIKNNDDFRSTLEAIRPETIVVVGYGRLIPQWMIELPPLGNINLHASLLPKYRGAAPIQWAIARGDAVTGVTTMRIDAGLDTGDILMRRELPILAEDTAETLAPKLAALGAPLVVETINGLKAGTIAPTKQEDARASLAPILERVDGLIDWSRTANEIWWRQRGFCPWPGAYSSFREKNVNLWSVKPLPTSSGVLQPGELKVDCDHLYAGCGEMTVLEIFELQLEGKKRMTARDFVNGYRPKPGEKLVSPVVTAH
jgi:methionyl-tRNA formyltransferase